MNVYPENFKKCINADIKCRHAQLLIVNPIIINAKSAIIGWLNANPIAEPIRPQPMDNAVPAILRPATIVTLDMVAAAPCIILDSV